MKFYVNITDQSSCGMDGFGAYFDGDGMDTISQCTIPLNYLNPQVQNANNNIIADTLNWVPITGTFTANGNEKYILIGNFKSDAATHTVIVNSANLPNGFTDICIDDVSCIELDLPAFACANSYTYTTPGDSVFLGRDPDVGINEDCMWYKLPNAITPIDTIAGFWAKPVTTTTYVVRQEICGNVKWDTVVVSLSALGIQQSAFSIQDLQLYPIPAQDELKLQWIASGPEKEFTKGEILNSLGQAIKQVELNYNSREALISTRDLPDGVYVLNLKSTTSGTVSKRFVISR